MTAPDRSGITDFPLAPTGPSTHESLPSPDFVRGRAWKNAGEAPAGDLSFAVDRMQYIPYSPSMARTRSDPGDVFSFAELALAGGLSRSTYQFLEKSQLLPGGRGLKDFK